MNLDLFKQGLIMATASRFSWDEADAGEDSVALRTSYRTRKYDDAIGLSVEFNKEGTLAVTFCFDSIACNKETLMLVNYFNRSVYFFKAYINPVGYGNSLIVEYATPNCTSVEQASELVEQAIMLLEDEGCAKYLRPLTIVTEA